MDLAPAVRSCVRGVAICADTGHGVGVPVEIVVGLVAGAAVVLAVVIAMLMLAFRSSARTAVRYEQAAGRRSGARADDPARAGASPHPGASAGQGAPRAGQ